MDAQIVGDRVVVTANFGTKIHKKVVGQVFEGEIHTITLINGKWCALDDVQGWLPLQYVMNIDKAKEHFDNRVKKLDDRLIALVVPQKDLQKIVHVLVLVEIGHVPHSFACDPIFPVVTAPKVMASINCGMA